MFFVSGSIKIAPGSIPIANSYSATINLKFELVKVIGCSNLFIEEDVRRMVVSEKDLVH